ncbi:MAG: UPF0149 family protein [Thiolinea sp.]
MLIFNCTQAAQDFFTVTRKGEKQSIVEAPPCEDMAEDSQHLTYADGTPAEPSQWLLHVVSIKRKNCLVAMHIETRFSVVIMNLKKSELASFTDFFKAYLVSQVLGYGQAHGIWQESDAGVIVKQALDDTEEARWFRRSDRSAQAQINDVVRELRFLAEEYPDLLENDERTLWFNQRINGFLRKNSYKEYIIPVEEMLIEWQRRYQQAGPEQLAQTRQVLSDHRRQRHNPPPAAEQSRRDDHSGFGSEPSPFPEDNAGMIMPGNGPLTAEEMDFLHETLFKYATGVSLQTISELHGFLTAIVSGPNMLPPSTWIHEIWGDEDEQPAWESMAEAEGFIGAVFKMMNQIARELMESPDTFTAIFMEDGGITTTSDWCNGYMNGVELDLEAWEDMPDRLTEKLDFLDESAMMLSMGGKAPSAKQIQQQGDAVVDAALQLHAYWLKQRSGSARSGVGGFGAGMTKPQPAVSQKVGRNDPCPCGSGKKYKKCCLH